MGWIRVLAFREQRPWWAVRPRAIYNYDGQRDKGQDRREEARVPDGPNAGAVPEAAAPAPGRAGQDAPAPLASGELKSMQKQEADGLSRNDQGGSFPGTGWGDRRNDPVSVVEFTAEKCATDNLSFRYEYASGLRALGIYRTVDRNRLRDRDNGELGFAKPPRW